MEEAASMSTWEEQTGIIHFQNIGNNEHWVGPAVRCYRRCPRCIVFMSASYIIGDDSILSDRHKCASLPFAANRNAVAPVK